PPSLPGVPPEVFHRATELCLPSAMELPTPFRPAMRAFLPICSPSSRGAAGPLQACSTTRLASLPAPQAREVLLISAVPNRQPALYTVPANTSCMTKRQTAALVTAWPVVCKQRERERERKRERERERERENPSPFICPLTNALPPPLLAGCLHGLAMPCPVMLHSS
ncbi:hypothetical protein L7F22_032298, partial [Adiantum nelumboides]|nr:hypothetical protein [Adiantum nelumboides]